MNNRLATGLQSTRTIPTGTTQTTLQPNNKTTAGMAQKLELIYFDVKGRAHTPRLAAAVGGIDIKDTRITREQCEELKPTLPYGLLPVLRIREDFTLSESLPIVQYLCRLGGLIPDDPDTAAFDAEITVAMWMLAEQTLNVRVANMDRKEKVPEILQNLLQSRFRPLAEKIDARIPEHKTKFIFGDKPSMADITIAGILDVMESFSFVDESPLFKNLPSMAAVQKAIHEHPKVKGREF